ncbi:MAG: hypothetical protein DRI40_04120 [Chloroflexi bacterium]|nr:MAG: hypothetical protein DRI40_04120 [Chloroflexota bacterium]
MNPTIRVTVIDDSQAEKCEGRCGLDLSRRETFISAAEALDRLFAGRVQLQYHELSDPQVGASYPDIAQKVATGSLALPLLLVNGKVRISGYFDIDLMQRVIQTEMEIEEP